MQLELSSLELQTLMTALTVLENTDIPADQLAKANVLEWVECRALGRRLFDALLVEIGVPSE